MRFFRLIFYLLFVSFLNTRFANAQFQYVSPLPNSLYHNPETNIILKNGFPIDLASLTPELVTLYGSISGLHHCNIILAEDKKTIIISPDKSFSEGETVSVAIANGFRKKTGEMITGTSFEFGVHAPRTSKQLLKMQKALEASHEEEWGHPKNVTEDKGTRDQCEIPPFTITSTGNEYDADVFYYNFRANDPLCQGKTILTNNGDSIFTEFDNNRGVGFTINRNGYLTSYNTEDSSFEMMDSTYTLVKKFFMGNGYHADEHEFLVFPDGNSFMMCYDVQPDLDLSPIGGLDSVDVIGAVLQQLDPGGNVIFEWRSWDHFLITDAIGWQQQLLPFAASYDYVHTNSMDLDYDGNLLLSSRHLCEITKIDLTTGDIMWRLGGENNQFTFVNDPEAPIHFSGQHDFRRLENGNYTMFNNGNYLSVIQSGAKEYMLDQTNKVATLVWSYKHPDINNMKVYGSAMGSVQRLPNGNTFINWGLVSQAAPYFPRFTEVDTAGNIVWEFNFLEDYYYVSYRANKFKWDRCAPPLDASFTINYISADSAELSWGDPDYSSAYIFEYKPDTALAWTSIPVDTNFIALGDLLNNAVYMWRVQTVCDAFVDSSAFSTIHDFSTLGTGSGLTPEIISTLRIYPNPCHDQTSITFTTHQKDLVTVNLIDVCGKVLQGQELLATPGNNHLSLDIKNLTAGVYLVEFKFLTGSAHKQLVVQ